MIWKGPHFGDWVDNMLHNLIHHDQSWMGTLARKAYGYREFPANPRKNVRGTKKYADGRQKGRK